jgi:hypothetical protein
LEGVAEGGVDGVIGDGLGVVEGFIDFVLEVEDASEEDGDDDLADTVFLEYFCDTELFRVGGVRILILFMIIFAK